MRCPRPWLPFIALPLALSCGARSNLQANAGSATGSGAAGSGGVASTSGASSNSSSAGVGGAGGSTTTTTSTSTSTSTTTVSASASTGSGGTGGVGGTGGGPVVVCEGVAVATPILTVDDPAGDLSQPSLVVLDTAPPTAAVVFAKQAQPPLTGPTARAGAFDGWGPWPPASPAMVDLHDPESSALAPGVSLLAASFKGMPASFGLLFSDFGGIKTTLALETAAGGQGTLLLPDMTGGTVLALAPDATSQGFLGAVRATNGGYFSLATLVSVPLSGYKHVQVGCATTPIAADAVADAGRWIFATALGTQLDWGGSGLDCSTKFSSIGPATSLDLAYVALDAPFGYQAMLTQVVQVAAPITRIRMATRPGGSWVVWGLDGVPALSGAPVTKLPALGPTFQIFPQVGTLVPTSFDVQPLGELLVIAMVDQVAGSEDEVQVAAVDASGAAKWSATVATGGKVDGPLSLRAAPDGSMLLVAWAELASGATSRRLRIARLTCLGGP